MSSLLPPKKDVALALLERASVFIHLDPRGDEVLVPIWFKKQAQLVLQVGLNMAVRIPDLDVGEESISCTLSFTRSPHYCYVPWSAVYALVGEDGRGMVWPEDIPSEVAAQTQSLTRRRPHLRPVDGGRSEAAEDVVAESGKRSTGSDSGTHPEVKAEVPAEHQAAATDSGDLRPSRSSEAVPRGGRRRTSERPYLRLVK